MRADRFGCADEAVDLAILPPRHRAAAQVEVDAARGDERRLGELRAHRERKAGHRDAMRVMRVDDVGLELFEQARQAPRGAEIHLGLRRERNEVEPLLRPLPQLAPGMCHEHRSMAEGAQPENGDEHLILTTTPRSRRVDVEREHLAIAAADGSRASDRLGRCLERRKRRGLARRRHLACGRTSAALALSRRVASPATRCSSQSFRIFRKT